MKALRDLKDVTMHDVQPIVDEYAKQEGSPRESGTLDPSSFS